MITQTADFIKKNAGTSISVASIVAVMGGYSLLLQHLDSRYCLAGEAQQTQQMLVSYMEKELEDRIFMIDLKGEENWTEEDRALRKRYVDRLNEIRKKKQ